MSSGKRALIQNKLRAQSAMEYLMTYGWSILIIAVVLGVMFQLGVFSSQNFAPKAQPGSCKVLRVSAVTSLEGVCDQLPQYAASFGPTSNMHLAYSPSFNSVQETFVFWFNVQNSNVRNGIIDNYWWWNNYGFEIEVLSGYLQLGFGTGTGYWGRNAAYDNLIKSNQFYFAAFVFGANNNQQVYVYVNGNLVKTINSAFAPTPSYMDIGVQESYPTNGILADVQFYNTTLDASQIQALYQEGIGGAPVQLQNLVGWWPLNGDTNDYSGNGNNGVPTSIVFTTQWLNGYTLPH